MIGTKSSAAWLLLVPFVVLGVVRSADARDPFEAARNHLVETAIIANGVKDPRVIQSSRETLRHEFISPALRNQAYYDMALPIGEDQTISSPFIVAYMTESLEPKPTDKVLEIGTGSGYQAAILSPLVKDVYSIEIKEVLGRRAARTLSRLGYRNVHTKIGDGYLGWPEHAPFDKIIVTCSPENVPQPLVDQLREGGRMIIPVGERYQQTLMLFVKKDGKLEAEALRPTLFVPMTGEAEDRRQVKPDPANPHLENADFEEPVSENGTIPGWYYQRQLELVEDTSSPSGKHYLKLTNKNPGRVALALQGLALDGRQVSKVAIQGWVKTEDVSFGAEGSLAPMIVLTFYDHQRKELGRAAVGPFVGSQDWREVNKTVYVPPTTREALFRITTYGAVGTLGVDNVSLQAER